MMDQAGAMIIPFPIQEKTLPVLREAIAMLESGELLSVAINLCELAMTADQDADFYDRTKAAYLALERVLIEGARL